MFTTVETPPRSTRGKGEKGSCFESNKGPVQEAGISTVDISTPARLLKQVRLYSKLHQ
jgi:hypothetical protein